MSEDWLYRQFLHSRLTPLDQKKELLEGGFSEVAVDAALKRFYDLTGQIKHMTPPHMLVDEQTGNADWYTGAANLPGSKFWPALKTHLLEDKGWTEKAVQSIDNASDKIVGWMQSPWASQIKTRGLVVGYVQSGKTANFTAVIAKAADAGYRFFIVLSGTKKSLRSQTQARLSRELVSLNDETWFTPTAEHDFKPLGNVNFFLSDKKRDKVICVVKKNAAILRKLHDWLKGASGDALRTCPFLIIDDEADEASVNTARGQADAPGETRDRSVINRWLVQLLRLLPKVAYIGYTATPFANVLIDPSYEGDLYPKDFIVTLPKPDGHFGTERIFGRERLRDDATDEEFAGLNMVRRIPDKELTLLLPDKKNHAFIPKVTDSLQEAVNYFWLACAARVARNQGDQHMTMLVHISQLIQQHNITAGEIGRYVEEVRQLISSGSPELGQYVEYLRLLWQHEQNAVPSSTLGYKSVSFQTLADHLPEVIQQTQVVADNSQSTNRLVYNEEPRIQIAVGGNTLSRGLTLEGLIVSYFARSASTYDTLLQMGRWFGYRPGYEDLPRIWMTSKLEEYFRTLATIEEEIRQDIAVYELERKTPRQFGVRIRTHPDLTITAPLKMQHAVHVQVSFDDSIQQTVLFNYTDGEWLKSNLDSVSYLLQSLEKQGLQLTPHHQHHVIYGVPAEMIIKFFGMYKFHENNRALQSKNLIGYINDQRGYGLLESWNIVIRGLTTIQADSRNIVQLSHHRFPLVKRARRNYQLNHAHIGVLMSKGDIGADLQNTAPKEVQKLKSQDIKSLRYKEFPDTGLLVVYLIDKDSQPANQEMGKVALDAVDHVVGLGIVLPPAEESSRGVQDYMAVKLDQGNEDAFEVEADEEEAEEA